LQVAQETKAQTKADQQAKQKMALAQSTNKNAEMATEKATPAQAVESLNMVA
jgi:hypothetical protein